MMKRAPSRELLALLSFADWLMMKRAPSRELLALLSFVLPGSQLLVYAICWLVIPNEPADS